jgi:hypothetical protein
MGLLDFLATAGPIATQAGGDLAQGQANADQTRIQQAIQTMQMQRQAEAQRIQNALNVSKTGEQDALTALHQRDAQKLQLGDAGYAPAMAQVAGDQKAAEWVTTQKQLDAEHQNRLDEITKEGGNALAVAQENARDAAARQVAQQTFIANQNDKNRAATAANEAANRTATATNQQNAQTAARQTHLQGIQQTQSGEVLPTIENWFHRGPLAHPVPSASPQTTPPVGGLAPASPSTSPANPSATPGTKPPVQQRLQQLKASGLSPAATLQQLRDEGYDDDASAPAPATP